MFSPAAQLAIVDIVITSIRIWPLVFSPVHEIIAYIYYVAVTMVFYHFVLLFTEASLIRLTIDWYWKRTPPFNDDFLMTFITLLNFILSSLVSGTYLLAKDSLKLFFSIQGIQDLPKVEFGGYRLKVGIVLTSMVDILLVTVAISQTIKMFKRWRQNRAGTVNENVNAGQGFFNTSKRNDEVVGARTQIALCIIVSMSVGPVLLAVSHDDQDCLTLEQRSLMELWPLVSMYFIVPLVLYIRSPRLRRHIRDEFF